tara:strand:+ start:3559 stop:4161 length:603 start_codon:yes stop_codon:yes gene_type:complete
MELKGNELLDARRRSLSRLQIPMLLGWVVPYAVTGGDVHPLWLAEFALGEEGGGIYLLLPAYIWALSVVFPMLFLIPNITVGREAVSLEWLQKCDGLLLLLMFMGFWTLLWMVCNPTAWYGGFYPGEEVGAWVIGPMIGYAFISLAPAIYVMILYIRTVLSPTGMEPFAAGTPRDDGKVTVGDSSAVGQADSSNFWDNLQ